MSQEATVTEPNQTETVVEPQQETTVEEGAPAPKAQTQEVAFDPAKIDPKVKEHFEKEYSTKYQDYEPSKKAAQELNAIKNDPRFQQWVQGLNKPEAPKPFEITEDQFTAALTDKQQFTKLVQDAARHLVDQQIGPKLQQTDQHFQLQAKTSELHATVQKFPDFKDLDKRGLIEPIIRKYPNVSFEDAYWMAKQHTFKEDVAKAARGQVEERKGSGVERPNNAPSKSQTVTKVASRLEAMERTAEDLRAGREIGQYDYD